MNREKEKIRKVAPVAQRRSVSAAGNNNLKTRESAMSGGGRSARRGAGAGARDGRAAGRAPAAPRFLRGRIYRASVRAERLVAASAPKGLVWLGVFVLGVIFARAPLLFSVYPFGIGFLCASVRYFPLAAVGVFAGALSRGLVGFPYASASVIITGARLLISLYGKRRNGRELFYVSANVRAYISALAAFACGLYGIIRNGYRYYDLFGSFLIVVVSPLFTYLVLCGASGEYKKSNLTARIVCPAFAASILFCLKDIAPLGVSLSAVGAAALAILAARKRGMLYGTAAGTLFGLAGAPSLIHVLSVFGLACGLSRRLSLSASLFIALPIACAFAYAVSGLSGLATSLGALALSAFLYLFLEYFGLLDRIDGVFEGEATPQRDGAELSCEERFEALSESFRSLSEICYALSDRFRRPDESDIRVLCDSVCEKYCAHCRASSVCWNYDYASTSDVMGKVVCRLSEGKKVTRGSIPAFFSARCPSIDGIIAEINHGCAALTKKQLQENRTETFAMDYEAIAALISRALEVNSAETSVNRRLTAAARSACVPILGEASVTVTGRRRLRVWISGFDADGGQAPPNKLKKSLEAALGLRLSEPRCSEKDGIASVTLGSVRRYGVQMSFLCRPKSEEADCGDCVSVFENREDYYYAMLSDGMGSGSEAALTSSVCSVFLKKMLSAGNAKDISIEMLNDLVRSSRSECSATIDLFELDMLTGKASFIKSGAAPSFLKRGGRLFRIQSKTLPVGIVRAADAEQVSYTVEHGDVIVMQSDGVAQSYEDCPWMANMLTRCWTDDLAVMCARILDAAEVNNAEKDDRSVCILRIIETK